MRPSKPSLNASLSCIFLLPGEIPSDVHPPIFMRYVQYSVISDRSLHKCMSAAEFIS